MKKCSILLFFIPIITLSLLYNLSAEDTTKAKDEVTSKQKIEKTSKPKKEIAIKEVNTIIKEEPFEFRKVFDLDGETNNEIIEDRDGFLWFGSYVGLVRYDGYDTKYYKAGPDSISAN